MKEITSILLVASLLALTACATPSAEQKAELAQNPIYFSRDISYQNVSIIKPEVVQQCEIAENLLVGIDERSSANGLPLTNSESPRVLSVEILNATPGVAAFGNLGSEPATLTVQFEVKEGDAVLISESKKCRTNLAGFLGLQPSACNKLEKCARSNGEYISERTFRVLYK